MTSSKNSVDADSVPSNPAESGDESEDESEVLEESPCGRWQKRREKVTQRDVPGIDCAFLAMDTDEGVEVVWNEVCISEKKSSKSQLEKIKQVFDNLIDLEHPNIVKFHKYWTDTKSDRPRVIFITEYMSSGSLRQFLKKTKKNNKTLKAWKRWCTQILSALTYLHSCEPPIIHGNLTTETIFIQHNGLIKIGSVAPDAIHSHVKTYKEEARHMHYAAPEYGGNSPVTTAVDIYSFGICSLEMAALDISGNGESRNHLSEESIQKAITAIEDPLQKDFVQKCLEKEPSLRMKARELLFHPVLFEVHSLRLLAAHCLIQHSVNITDETYQSDLEPSRVIAEFRENTGKENKLTVAEANTLELEKFLEDVKNGVFPLTYFAPLVYPPLSRTRAASPELAESVKSISPEPSDTEKRHVLQMQCTLRKGDSGPVDVDETLKMTLLLRMDDKMNRQLTCEVSANDSGFNLADELVRYGFISSVDRNSIGMLIDDTLKNRVISNSPPHLIEQKA
ncbi:hypothetical protein CAPTEDRAFT_222925 [Capitella teleta]|uniref:Nuclear receptor-binding protein homolog n=1 Tax=Capitella teleta TaxID=283909 RepID=X2ATR9_CAPTE|nr:hypothetical protein CAPTEDRAFT_222925 [Capitella teleta]|eukprot:ELU04627.1 hypothetical protein CAPTEDRAFT_222925 [Capitella teleta]